MMKPTHFDNIKSDLQVKEAENYLLQSELTNTIKPSIDAFESIAIVIQMLSELNIYIRKNGENEQAKKSKERLTKLFNNLHDLSSLTTSNHSLKLTNKFLHNQNNLLRVELYDLKKKMDDVNKAFEGV